MKEFNESLTEMFGSDHGINEGDETFNSLYEKYEANKNQPFDGKELNENESEPFDNTEKSHGESDPFDESDKKNVDEMKKVQGMSGVEQNKGNKDDAGGPTKEKIDEEDAEIEVKGDEVEIEIGGEDDKDKEEKVDEIHGVSYSAGKVNAARLPNDGAEYRDRAGHSREDHNGQTKVSIKR